MADKNIEVDAVSLRREHRPNFLGIPGTGRIRDWINEKIYPTAFHDSYTAYNPVSGAPTGKAGIPRISGSEEDKNAKSTYSAEANKIKASSMYVAVCKGTTGINNLEVTAGAKASKTAVPWNGDQDIKAAVLKTATDAVAKSNAGTFGTTNFTCTFSGS
jgi:hypothetical protein